MHKSTYPVHTLEKMSDVLSVGALEVSKKS